jgi:GTP cyclohydrolase II
VSLLLPNRPTESSKLPVGKPEYMSDTSKELTLRVHDECNGSDVFGSDICTCKPYLIFAIEECIRCAQRGGVGVVVYFRKEGRALGEVTKCVQTRLMLLEY